jgi:hypothetical protein
MSTGSAQEMQKGEEQYAVLDYVAAPGGGGGPQLRTTD